MLIRTDIFHSLLHRPNFTVDFLQSGKTDCTVKQRKKLGTVYLTQIWTYDFIQTVQLIIHSFIHQLNKMSRAQGWWSKQFACTYTDKSFPCRRLFLCIWTVAKTAVSDNLIVQIKWWPTGQISLQCQRQLLSLRQTRSFSSWNCFMTCDYAQNGIERVSQDWTRLD